MKYQLILSWPVYYLLLVASQFGLFAQGYTIESYHVDVEIREDGSALVLETLDIDFNESRHGIYRDIPLGYKGKTTSTADAIMLANVKVIDDPFVLMNKPGLMRIRIGSADKKVRGNKQYKISYEVLGAIEQFDDMAEFSWNIIGDRWDVKIREASATIRYPFKITDANQDVLLNVKRKQVPLSGIKHELLDNKLEMEFPGSFNKWTGVALALRFKDHDFPVHSVPAAVISDHFFIPHIEMQVQMDENGILTIAESYRLKSKSNRNAMTRLISASPLSNNKYGTIYPYPDLMTAMWAGSRADISMNLQDQTYQYRVLGHRVPRDSELRLSYQLGGAISTTQDQVVMQLDLGSFEGKVAVDTIDLSFKLPAHVTLNELPKLTGFVSQKVTQQSIRYVRKSFLTGPIRQSFRLNGLNENNLVSNKENLYSEKIVDDLEINIAQNKNGKIEINESILLQNKMPSANQKYFIGSRINTANFPYDIENPSLLTCERKLSVGVSNMHTDYRQEDGRGHQRAISNNVNANSRFHATYSIDPMVVDGRLIVPVYFSPETPIDHISVTVDNEQGDRLSDITASEFFINEHSELDLFDHDGYEFLAIPLHKGTLTSTSISFIDRIRANDRLIGSLLIAGLLYLLWFRYGRDKKYDGSMHPHPPDYMTPAEAGYLWDGKLHGRDLISLIYHWAARGLLTIEEVDVAGSQSEYYLEKQNDLPKDAFAYEKVLFDRLFSIGETRVKISSLRNSFYKTMSTATKSLKKEFESRHMYEPFTRGIGTLFVIFGFLVIITGFVVLGIHSTHSDYSWSLPMLIIGMSMLFFGYYLPKKTALGTNYFIVLQKFNKFIDEAPVSELASLYEKDSQYFQNTLAYAIVLGKAKDWAKRFDGLITAPPSYYRGSRYNQFSPMLFTDNVLTGMRTMENDFYSTPAPPPSTSTYSGGRSSSFGGGGGFSSGGGFGGGGGSSW